VHQFLLRFLNPQIFNFLPAAKDWKGFQSCLTLLEYYPNNIGRMGYVCALRNCKTRALSGLFSFPKDPELKKKWLEKCVLTKSIKPSSTVCLKHFRQCDIRTRKVTRRMCLRKGGYFKKQKRLRDLVAEMFRFEF
jgi:hypothetical protein